MLVLTGAGVSAESGIPTFRDAGGRGGLHHPTRAAPGQLSADSVRGVGQQWSDLEVSPSEKTYALSLALRLGLPDDEAEQVRGWLETPPSADEVDPNLIPPKHRALFLEAVEKAVEADRVVDSPERESLRLLRDLLG